MAATAIQTASGGSTGSGSMAAHPQPHHTRGETMRSVTPMSPHAAKAYCSNEVINSRYTPWTFLPKNLYEQFRRPLNMYFLLVSCLQFISIIAPVNPLSTLLPLVFAFSLTAAKEGYDDVKRHRQDAEYNNRKFKVLRNGRWETLRSLDIHVGDIVQVRRNEELPCDLVAFASPEPVVFIRTDNLDGEIDLKPRDRLPVFAEGPEHHTVHHHPVLIPHHHEHHDEPAIEQVCDVANKINVVYPPPSATIDSFDAKIEVRDIEGHSTYPLTEQHLLLQSSYLKNTAFVYGIAVYTGNETKCGMNKHEPPVKWCKLDRQVSNYSKIIFIFQMTVGLVFGIIGYEMSTKDRDKRWYATGGAEEPSASYIIYPLRFFLLTSVMIPISFKFIVDMSKYFMALVLEWDLEMYDESRGEGMKVKNSGIVEDLARVEYVLTDKTGTLTKNEMTLVSCSVNGHRYTGLQTPELVAVPESDSSKFAWREFFKALAVCNTIDVEETETEPSVLEYLGASPDEEALCRGASNLGIELQERTKSTLVVNVLGIKRTFTIHEVFAFTSERKCMSVMLQEHIEGHLADHVVLLSKGADDRILPLLRDPLHHSERGKAALQHLREFSSVGLRTLVFAMKQLSLNEFKAFKEKYDTAKLQMVDRRQTEEALQAEMERGLMFLGVSAIEDKLQDNVRTTLMDLIDANVKAWMLTGDKVETAKQIALSCGLMSKGDKCVTVSGEDWQSTLLSTPKPSAPKPRPPDFNTVRSFSTISHQTGSSGEAPPLLSFPDESPRRHSSVNYGSSMREIPPIPGAGDEPGSSGETVLVIHGDAVDGILKSTAMKRKFREISEHCKSVICARVTPSQKARLTRFVAEHGHTTLSIGDGGNDVAMIQEAHVGVGVMGKEGTQAARAADFSISQFQYLTTLMFVHGHLSYKRTCYVVQYSFYKSMLISFIQLVFNAFNTYVTGVSFWNSFGLTLWNGAYTLPQTLFYCLDKCAPREVLKQYPALYRLCQSGYGQTPYTFYGFIFRGMLQAAGTLFFIMYLYGPTYAARDGSTESVEIQYTVGYSALILLQIFTVLIESHSMTWFNIVGLFGMPLVYFLTNLIYSSIRPLAYYGVFERTFSWPMLLSTVLICALLFVPHAILHVGRLNWKPNAVEVFRRVEVEEQRRMQRNILRHRMLSKRLSTAQRLLLRLQYIGAHFVHITLAPTPGGYYSGSPTSVDAAQMTEQAVAVDP